MIISIHAPAKGATHFVFRFLRFFQFQSTLPRRERRHRRYAAVDLLVFQSTLPRRERLIWRGRNKGSNLISIHAPAKGATPSPSQEYPQEIISIHAPAKGATVEGNCYLLIVGRFQSTLPRRERHNKQHPDKRITSISIHAPAKGATQMAAGQLIGYEISIHAPAKGATHLCLQRGHGGRISIHAPAKGATKILTLWTIPFIFQSTLPRRERQTSGASIQHFWNFNPRSREGSDRRQNW